MATKEKNRYRNKQIKIRVTEEEKEKIKSNMKKVGMTNLGEFARLLMIYGRIVKLNTIKLAELAYEVNRVGNNINQIAKVVNTQKTVYKNELDSVFEQLEKLNAYVDTLYNVSDKLNGGN